MWPPGVVECHPLFDDPPGLEAFVDFFEVDREIKMPVKKVTSVVSGGPNLDILYATSMAKPPLLRFPGDGVQRDSLFAIHDLGIKGVPEARFAAQTDCICYLRQHARQICGFGSAWLRCLLLPVSRPFAAGKVQGQRPLHRPEMRPPKPMQQCGTRQRQ